MPKCIELLPCDWLISNLCYQAIEQVYLIKWPVCVCVCVCVYIYIYIYIHTHIIFFMVTGQILTALVLRYADRFVCLFVCRLDLVFAGRTNGIIAKSSKNLGDVLSTVLQKYQLRPQDVQVTLVCKRFIKDLKNSRHGEQCRVYENKLLFLTLISEWFEWTSKHEHKCVSSSQQNSAFGQS